MRIAVVFDTPYDSWHYEDHARQMAKEVAAWKVDELLCCDCAHRRRRHRRQDPRPKNCQTDSESCCH